MKNNRVKLIGIIVTIIMITALAAGYLLLTMRPTTQEREKLPELTFPVSAGKITQPENYVANTSLPHVDEVMVYKYRPRSTAVLRSELQTLQTVFGLDGVIEESEDRLVASKQPLLEAHTLSGIITYWNLEKAGNPTNHNIPNETEAIQTAEAFLNQNNLQPSLEMGSPIVSYDTAERVDPDTNTSVSTRIGATVRFPLRLSGMYIGRVKTGIVVRLGTEGEIVFYANKVRNWETFDTYRLIDPDDALQNFKNRGVTCGWLENATASIDSVSIRYWSEPPGVEQTYLQPVYVFEGMVQGIDPSSRLNIRTEFIDCIPAVDY